MAYIIGITGSIATGKSTVSNYLKSLGYLVVDSDRLAYDALTIDKESINKVAHLFPEVIENHKINRKILANIIFNDRKRKEELNAIVHPYVIHQLMNVKNDDKEKDNIVFFDIPLLFEVQLEYLCDEIWVVYVDESTQLKRLISRNHYSKQEALSRIRSQMSIEEKKEKAMRVLDNRGDLTSLYKQIDAFLMEVVNEFSSK